jgi:hypothetical protein
MRLDDLTRDGVYEPLAQAIAGLAVDLPKGDSLCGCDGRIQCHRARDEGQLEIALPMRSRGHSTLHTKTQANKSNSSDDSDF